MHACTLAVAKLAPAYTKITKHIFVGSAKSIPRYADFDMIVNCAKEQRSPKTKDREIIRVPLIDAPFDYLGHKQELYQLYQVAYYISEQIISGKKVLFYCHMGLNRSSLMAALTLLHLGYSPSQAISMLKRRNTCVLSNDSFVKAIHQAAKISS